MQGSGQGSGSGSGSKRLIDYPRAGKAGFRRWLPSWRLVLGIVLTLGFLLLGLVVAAYATTEIPEPDQFAQAQVTTVRYANNPDGTPGPVMGTFAQQDRKIVDPATIPPHVGQAVVASEDETFYENAGISPRGMARAFLNNIRGGETQGGSTITQQYVERYYAGQTTTDYVGKFREALMAVKIAQSEDKDQVLGNYLNTIYFGRGTYGIEAAAQAYFGVPAAQLTVSQGAMLAGIIPSPSNWDPAVDPEKTQQRWERVLDNMVDGGWLSEADRAAQVFPETLPVATSQTYAGPQGYLLDMVRRELRDRASLTDDQIDTVGLEVVTTIQQPAQAAAEAAVASLRDGTLAGEPPSEATKVALTSIDPADGAIVALYGGPDFITQSRNAVTQDAAQAGSTFKPFALVAALENGVPLSERFNGRSPREIDGWGGSVGNFGGQDFGDLDLVDATANSVNTIYAQLNVQVGPEKTAEVAKRAGITTEIGTNPANVLGTDTVHPIDLASSYATFAAQGFLSQPFIVRQVTYLKDGSVAYEGAGAREQVFQPDVMADATYALTKVVEDGSGKRWVAPLGRPIAGKTGTSNENKSAWFAGYTPQLATVVALYQPTPATAEQPNPGQDTITPFGNVREVTGGTWPAKLWATYMEPVLELPQYAEVVAFPERANVNRRTPTATSTPTPTEEPTPEETAPAEPTTVAVPGGLAGMRQADAEAAVLNAGLTPAVTQKADARVEKGRVISASPGGGTEVPAGSTVSIVVSSGPPAPQPTPPPVPTPTPTPTEGAAQEPPGNGNAGGIVLPPGRGDGQGNG